jgi:hypothetical protein
LLLALLLLLLLVVVVAAIITNRSMCGPIPPFILLPSLLLLRLLLCSHQLIHLLVHSSCICHKALQQLLLLLPDVLPLSLDLSNSLPDLLIPLLQW